ncbi:F-box domain-containing protein [Candida albicans]
MSDNYLLPFDSLLPIEILYQIIQYVGIENLIQLLPIPVSPYLQSSFIHHNPNIKRAIDNLIVDSNITFNNRLVQHSLIHIYLRTRSYLQKNNLRFLPSKQSTLQLLSYCQSQNIPITITISYYLSTLSDLWDFIELLKNQQQTSSSIRYNLELEIIPGFLYNFSLNYVFDQISDSIGTLVETIMVYNYSGSFIFKNENFPYLKNLWFEDSNIKFNSNLPSTIKLLHLYPNRFGWNNNEPIIIKHQLPYQLEELNVGNCTIKNQATITHLDNLSSITLYMVKDSSANGGGQFIKQLVTNNLVNDKLSCLKVDFIWDSQRNLLDFQQLLLPSNDNENDREFIGEKLMKNLQTLSITNYIPFDVSNWKNLTRLKISRINNPQIFETCGRFPDSLQSLKLTNNNIKDLAVIDKLIGPNNNRLKYLSFSDNPIDWNLYVPNFTRFTKLKYLKLFNTQIGKHFHKINYPDSVEVLSLEVNQISSIQGIKFPTHLKNLGIGSNWIKKIYRPNLPHTIETIHLTENKLTQVDLSCNNQGQELLIEILYLNFNPLSNFKQIKLPNHLKILNMDNCKFKSISNLKFCSSLVELSFNGCELSQFENVSWNEEEEEEEDNDNSHSSSPNLKYLNLSQNDLTHLNVQFPSTLQVLNLSMNKLTSLNNTLTSTLQNLDQLQVLNLSSNQFQKFQIHFNSINLKVLDLSFNSLKSINLTFPRSTITNLQTLNLCSNKLTFLNDVMIGHNKNLTRHENLIEIDLTNNKIKSVSEINDNGGISHFPQSLKCFFIGHTGQQDRFGYDMAKNIVIDKDGNDGLCKTKRIDIP